MKQLPNILTVSRIFLTVLFIIFMSKSGLQAMIFAAVAFLFASLTDFYDGYFAKKRNLVSNFGKIMDPIADKFLILVAFFVFAQMNIIAGWMFLVIFLRETLVTGSRLWAIRRGKYLAAERAGKYKTISQIVVISVILIFMIIRESTFAGRWVDPRVGGWYQAIEILMLITIGLTVFSGLSYYRNYKKFTYAQ